MALSHDLERIAAEAAAYAASGERVAGILAAEPLEIGRIYLCAYESGADHAWLAFDDEGTPVADRYRVRAAASLAGLCEVAEESAGGGEVARRLAQTLGWELLDRDLLHQAAAVEHVPDAELERLDEKAVSMMDRFRLRPPA